MKPKPETEIKNETEIRNRNQKPKLKLVSKNETETKTETETEIRIPSGEELLSVGKVEALIDLIIDAAQDVGANLLETRQACMAVYSAASSKIASNAEEAAREREKAEQEG